MNSVVVAFGIAGIVLALGIILRAKIKFFQDMLMPAPVIGGIIVLILVNVFGNKIDYVSTKDFSSIVDTFFVFSFIAVGLGNKKNKNKLSKEEKKKLSKDERKALKNSSVAAGSISLGLVWCAIYGIQAFAGGALFGLFGKAFNANAMQGVLLSFGFSQGPGQAITYGQIFENTYNVPGAESIAVAFAIFGFLSAFIIGVPLARYGIKKKISSRTGEIGEVEKRGYYKPFEKGRSLGRSTTYGGNIETISTHVAFLGISYIIALGFSKAISFVPSIGESFSAMKFFWGMLAGTLIRKILESFKLEHILDDRLLSRITAFLTDYVVVCAFASVKFGELGIWVVPIIITSVILTFVTLIVCIFFCQRMGSDHDFEKLLGLYGTSTGTVPSGISLIRIVDPMLTTPTAQELGSINIVGILSAPIITLSTLAGIGKVSITVALIGFLISAIVDIIILFAIGGIGKHRSYKFIESKKKIENISANIPGTYRERPEDEDNVEFII